MDFVRYIPMWYIHMDICTYECTYEYIYMNVGIYLYIVYKKCYIYVLYVYAHA